MSSNSEKASRSLVSGLRQVLGDPATPLSLHEPEFRGNEWNYVKECIDTGWVSSVGKYVDEFERRLAEIAGARHAVAVVNGTAALQVGMQLAGVRTGDEVLVPSLSFVATANAVSHCGAIPHFVDSDAVTLGLSPQALAAHLQRVAEPAAGGLRNRETGRRISAIVPMHTFGRPIDLACMLEVAGRFGLPFVEDAAESLGSSYRGQHTGTFGCVGTLSFNGNKIVTTGGGGALITNDPELAKRAKYLTTTAKRPHRWEFFHDEVAFNYRLPNINAALGCAQLESLPGFLLNKRLLAAKYRAAYASAAGLGFVDEQDGCDSNFWLNAVLLDAPDMTLRDELLDEANRLGYHCRPVWTLLHRLPMYQSCPRADLSVAERLEASLINIPSSAKLANLTP